MSKKGALAGTTLLGGGYLLGRSLNSGGDNENIQLKDQASQPNQPQSANQTKPRKATSKSATHQTSKSTASQTQATQQAQDKTSNTPTVGVFLPELLKLYQLSSWLAQQYEEEAKTYYQVFQEYSEKLEKLVPYIALNLSKTPLGMMTGLDLTDKIYHLLKYYPWDYAKEIFPKVLTGYYILKANGHEDLSNYTIEDLAIASENPALAQATNQNILNILTNIAENHKLVMQSALDQIGKLKDLYTYRLNVLKAQADMIKDIIDAILKEEKQRFDQYIKTWDMRVKEFKAQTDAWYKAQRASQGWANIELKKQKQMLKEEPLIKIQR
jgi:hypothetical protein